MQTRFVLNLGLFSHFTLAIVAQQWHRIYLYLQKIDASKRVFSGRERTKAAKQSFKKFEKGKFMCIIIIKISHFLRFRIRIIFTKGFQDLLQPMSSWRKWFVSGFDSLICSSWRENASVVELYFCSLRLAKIYNNNS